MDRDRFIADMLSEAKTGYGYYEGAIQQMIDAYLLRMDAQQYKWLEDRAKSRIYFPKLNAKAKE